MKSSNMSWKFRIVCIESQRTKDRNVQKSSQGNAIKNTFLPNSKCSMGRIHSLCINLITAFFFPVLLKEMNRIYECGLLWRIFREPMKMHSKFDKKGKKHL